MGSNFCFTPNDIRDEKNKFFAFALGFDMELGFAQTTSPQVIGSGGDYDTIADAQLSWTLGEIVTETVTDGNTQLTQGFQQVTLEITAIGKT